MIQPTLARCKYFNLLYIKKKDLARSKAFTRSTNLVVRTCSWNKIDVYKRITQRASASSKIGAEAQEFKRIKPSRIPGSTSWRPQRRDGRSDGNRSSRRRGDPRHRRGPRGRGHRPSRRRKSARRGWGANRCPAPPCTS